MSSSGGGSIIIPQDATMQQPSTFQQVITNLENFAVDEWHKIEAGAVAIEQKLVPIVENTFVQLANDFGQLAVQTVVQLMGNAYSTLTGQEKNGMTVATIIQSAEAAGKQVLVSDAQALAKNAFGAVTGTQPPVAPTPPGA